MKAKSIGIGGFHQFTTAGALFSLKQFGDGTDSRLDCYARRYRPGLRIHSDVDD